MTVTRIIGTVAGALWIGGAAAPAMAQTLEEEMMVAPMPAPRHAFELGADFGYTQGFGPLGDGRSVRDVAGAGMGLGLRLGYRFTPSFAFAANVGIQGFDPSSTLPSGTMVRGATAGLSGTFHIAPHEHADPWLSLGGGYRMIWEIPGGTAPTTLTHGFELGKVEVGLDVRPSESLSLSPMIGAGLDMFAWQKASGADNTALTGSGVSAFLFAGVRGRFDVGGQRVMLTERVGASQIGSR